MSKPAKHALTIYSAPQFRLAETEVADLETIVAGQIEDIAIGERRNAALAILVGFNLQRLRYSTKNGKWGPRLKEILTKVKKCSPGTANTYASYWMRLATKCAEKKRLSLPDLLTLPGSQAEMDMEAVEASNSRRLLTAISEFVGTCSLHELLVKHEIKGVVRDDESEDGQKPAPGTAEDYFANVAQTLDGWRKIVTSRESLVRLSPKQLDQLNDAVSDGYSQFRKLYAEARKTAKA